MGTTLEPAASLLVEDDGIDARTTIPRALRELYVTNPVAPTRRKDPSASRTSRLNLRTIWPSFISMASSPARAAVSWPAPRCVHGEDALQSLRDPANRRSGLILLDLNLPVMNGSGFLTIAKGEPVPRRIPVVIRTIQL